MADWSLLRSALGRVDSSITFTWAELDRLVGGLPPSASRHRAWWSGDRTHVNAWRSAGFSVAALVMGREVTFVRGRPGERRSVRATTRSTAAQVDVLSDNHTSAEADVLLVACVKEKQPKPAAARDLYVSALIRKERAYAQRRGQPWFIFSAEHGLVAPTEWLAPYDRYLGSSSGWSRSSDRCAGRSWRCTLARRTWTARREGSRSCRTAPRPDDGPAPGLVRHGSVISTPAAVRDGQVGATAV